MKILRTSDDRSSFLARKEKANHGCDICPCCGETKGLYFDEDGKLKGMATSYRTWNKGIFHRTSYKADTYECKTCGAKWESDPYENWVE